MNEVVLKRATNNQQKEARRDAILDAARTLFLQSGFFDVNMATIARQSGLAKGTVYLYFKTKEEIFLALSTEELSAWLDEVDETLKRASSPHSVERLVDQLVDCIARRENMKRLASLLHLVLERNVSFEEALTFKLGLKQRSEVTSRLIEKALPFLKPGQGLDVLMQLHCYVVGWGQMSDPTPTLAEVLEHPDLKPFKIDFKEQLATSLTCFLYGLEALNRR
ncbi:MAG: TetR/AcrR family transcriptional regulator [Sneathiellales bacterium]|nr:TetR/AcrR family transcriptional regulator [Sneathiellales bacterium]